MKKKVLKKGSLNASFVNKPCIYAILDVNDIPVYVGKSKNLRKRIDVYFYPNSCHNSLLRDFLLSNDLVIKVLEYNPPNLNAAEKFWIKKHKKTLLNLVGGGDQNWRHHTRKPWMANQSVKCPSDMLLRHLKNRKLKGYEGIKKDIDKIRGAMNTKERATYEVMLAKNNYPAFMKPIEKWLNYTEDRLVEALSG